MSEKIVLVVLSSGDHYFYAENYGAKTVDAIDINLLTYYFAVLRKYLMSYYKCFYPSESIIKSKDFLQANLDSFEMIVKEKNEFEYIYQYWNGYIRGGSEDEYPNLFQDSVTFNDLGSNLTSIVSPYEPLNFFSMSSNKKFELDKTYDVVFSSNVIEQCRKAEDLMMVIDNLQRLLNVNGKAICSTCCHTDIDLVMEVFGRCFELSEMYYIDRKLFGYQLIKKC